MGQHLLTAPRPSRKLAVAPRSTQAPLLQKLRVPARPHLFYAAEWKGYDYWLGRSDTPLVFPTNYGQGRSSEDGRTDAPPP